MVGRVLQRQRQKKKAEKDQKKEEETATNKKKGKHKDAPSRKKDKTCVHTCLHIKQSLYYAQRNAGPMRVTYMFSCL